MVTEHEVKQRGAEEVTSLMDKKLEATEKRLTAANVELDTCLMNLEEESRRTKCLQTKVEEYEDKEEKTDQEMLKIKEELECKCQEVASTKQAFSITGVDLKETAAALDTLKK